MRSTILLILVLAAVVGLYRIGTDPYRTALPMEVEDLSPIEPQLAKLPPEDRELVTDYLKRSNGDVLPAQFADPDDPLTARTFAEAIALEKTHREKMKVEQARLAAFRAERDAQFKPLRDIVTARIVNRQELTEAEIYGAPGAGQPLRDNERRSTVITYRFWNRGNRTITTLRGLVEVAGSGLMPAASCWIDDSSPIGSLDHRDVRCRTPKDANAADRALMQRPIAEIPLGWYPREIRFDDGQVLKGPQ
ncbi:MAG TPA: hypothetical protein PLB00_12005 [Pseudomonadota bacterium]|jgi:hypothetical protein|nr:hypothetical protein [Pseudomonadota bacterium]